MKFGILKSVGHNIADSLASGIGFMIDVYEFDVFEAALQSPEGCIEVDFLSGTVTRGVADEDLLKVVALYGAELPVLCLKHGIEASGFKTLKAHFGVDRVYGPHFRVTIEDTSGRQSVDQYIGIPGRKVPRRH